MLMTFLRGKQQKCSLNISISSTSQWSQEMAERYDKIEDMKAQGPFETKLQLAAAFPSSSMFSEGALELQKLEESKKSLEDLYRHHAGP